MKLSTATSHQEVEFRCNRVLHVLAVLFGSGWTVAAIAPRDRADWLLENLLVVLLVIACWPRRSGPRSPCRSLRS